MCEILLNIQTKEDQNQTPTEVEEITIQAEDNINQKQDNDVSDSDIEEEIYRNPTEIAHRTRIRGRPSRLWKITYGI